MISPLEMLQSELYSLQRQRAYKMRTDAPLEEIQEMDRQIEALRATVRREKEKKNAAV
jgi:hypothetical protein